MKIRYGFVTNSSSSSFILGFKSKETMRAELAAEDLTTEQFADLIRECENAEGLNLNNVLNMIALEESFGYRYDGKKSCEEFETKAQGKDYFVSVNYSDNDGSFYSEMEHYVVPELKCCLRRDSHH